MIGLEVEVARAALIIGLVLTAFLSKFTRIITGGAITATYLALLALTDNWLTIGGWVVLSVAGLLAIRFVAERWPMPRRWLFAVGVAVPATLHLVGVLLAGLPQLEGFSDYLAAGLYVTSGLTAYDAQRQGLPRTLVAALGVGAVCYAILLGIQYGLRYFSADIPVITSPVFHDPMAVLACILIALSIRTTLRWGTGGIVGALFFIGMLNVLSTISILVMALVGAWIVKKVDRLMGLTPRQRHFSILIVGGIVSWFGLFWAEWLGIPGVALVNQYSIEPLLVIGLMIGEVTKFGVLRTLGGTSLVIVATLFVSYLGLEFPSYQIVGLVIVAVVSGALAVRGLRDVENDWHSALAGGDEYQFQSLNSETPED